VSGNTRSEALSRARNALNHLVVEGVHTTVPFLSEVIEDPEFVAGQVDTGFLERFLERRRARTEAT
jgi:acetyl-CoA carboxylase biotin carboxylase subunit